MICWRLGLTVCVVCCKLSAQEGSAIFQLWLPDFFESPFEGGKSVIEIPDRPIQRLSVVVKDAQRRNLNPSRYAIFVNGKGMGNVFEERGTLDGMLLVMDPQALRKRPDELFDPSENAIEVRAEDRRGRVYYQNWIVRTNGSRNTFFGYATTLSPDDPKGFAPDLVITEPTVPPVLTASQNLRVVVKGRISANASLSINGQSVIQPRPTTIALFEETVTVKPGDHEIHLVATDNKGNSRAAKIPVYGPATTPPAHFVGQKYAVVIGVSRFGSTTDALPPIPVARADAQEFAEILERQAGFKHENIRMLLDDAATPESVRFTLTDFASRAQPSDIFLLYVVTQGLHDPRPNREGHIYLALSGTQVVTLDSTALALQDLELFLNRGLHTNQAFLIFDVAHELNDQWRLRGGENLVNTYLLKLLSETPGWSVLVSGSAGQNSQERKQSGSLSSLFAHWLSAGINGAADVNGDRVVTAKELFAFVSEKVQQESGGSQAPRFRLSEQSSELLLVGH